MPYQDSAPPNYPTTIPFETVTYHLSYTPWKQSCTAAFIPLPSFSWAQGVLHPICRQSAH